MKANLSWPGLGAMLFLLACNPGRPAGRVETAIGGAEAANRMAVDSGPRSSALLPEVAPVRGPLAIRVVYPTPGDRVDAADSSFMFGSVGSGDAALTINGQPVQVWPNGAWLAWIAFPPDSLMRFELVATRGAENVTQVHEARRVRRSMPGEALWLDSLSVSPAGKVWWPAGEFLPVSVRASEGASVSIALPGGTRIPLVTDPGYDDVSWGIRAFDRDTTNLVGRVRADRYIGTVRGSGMGRDPGPVLGPQLDSLSTPDSLPIIEVVRGADTVRARWNISLRVLDSLPLIAQLDDDTARTGQTDGITVGRALPGGSYQWFFPAGTRATVTGRINGDLRLRLSSQAISYVAAGDAHPLPVGSPPLRAVVGSATLTPTADRFTFRLPLSQRVPFQVTETEHGIMLKLYSAAGDVNWIRYGGTDSLVKGIAWDQPAADEVTISFALAQPVWGFRTRWQQNDLILEIRRPPVINAARPLAGRRIVVDAGHPPLGATGPTGLREADANLAVSLELRRMLAEAGAEVIMTRTTDTPVELYPRVKLADSVNADLLISIHNNALPDGVNPFTNNGTSVFYNHPRSVPLAMAVQRALVKHLGLRDLGVGRGDLALVRPTWMPAILTEGLFMMVPDQEAALRSPEGQRLYALGVFEGIQDFLRSRITALPLQR
jgi:N-acetylmuramoyl-L-alanine amidase